MRRTNTVTYVGNKETHKHTDQSETKRHTNTLTYMGNTETHKHTDQSETKRRTDKHTDLRGKQRDAQAH